MMKKRFKTDGFPTSSLTQAKPSSSNQKSGKCVMSIDSKLRKVDSISYKTLQYPGTIRPITYENCNNLSDAGKLLIKACSRGDLEAVEGLINKGAPFLSDWLGTTPLHIATQYNHPKIVQRLLIGGISINCLNKVDRTALHMAAEAGFLDVVKVLVARGADVNCLDMLSMTPLHWAVQNGHTEVVRFLLNKTNVNPNYKNKFNLTCMDIANQIENQDIIFLLKSSHLTPKPIKTQENSELPKNVVDFSFEPLMMVREDQTVAQRRNSSVEEPMEIEDDPIIDIIGELDFEPEHRVRILHSETIKPPRLPPPLIPTPKITSTPMVPSPKPVLAQPKSIMAQIESFIAKNEPKVVQPPPLVTSTSVGHQHKVNILRKTSTANASKNNQTQANNNSNTSNNENEALQAKATIDDEAIRLLQQHLLSNDDVEEFHILDKAIENGHSVVLTDAGKEILKSIEQTEEDNRSNESRKILTVTPEQFLEMMNGTVKRPFKDNVKVVSANPPSKKIVMNKSKFMTKNSNSKASETKTAEKSASRLYTQEEVDVLMTQLLDAKKTIEEYKIKLMKKEQETERYKKQLRLLMDLS